MTKNLDLYTPGGKPLRRSFIPIEGVTKVALDFWLASKFPGYVKTLNEVAGPFITVTGDTPRVLRIVEDVDWEGSSREVVEVAVPRNYPEVATGAFNAWVAAKAEEAKRKEEATVAATAVLVPICAAATPELRNKYGIKGEEIRRKFMATAASGSTVPPTFFIGSGSARVRLEISKSGAVTKIADPVVESGSYWDDLGYGHASL